MRSSSVRSGRITSEVADRLKVNRPHGRSKTNRRAQNIADLLAVDSRHQGRHEHHSQLGSAAVCNGFELGLEEGLSADCLVDVVADSVKLKEDAGQPGILQLLGVIAVAAPGARRWY